MTASRQQSRAWVEKLAGLARDARLAEEALLVGIYQARQNEVSQRVVARGIGDKSSSGIKAKADKGKAILERRRGSRGGSSTP